MKSSDKFIKAVPTNIITGFLGVGKSSAIQHLLKQKPDNERWAILVNEFGEIGIDGTLLSGDGGEEHGVFIKEVPGGCMCCTANLPMQIALNQLLARARPHRLLIEPTGLGHPQEVLDILTAPHYRDVVRLQNTITLVDARKFSDVRYTSHETFNQQLDIADCLVANKQALYAANDRRQLAEYLFRRHKETTPVRFTDFGDFPLSLLDEAVPADDSKPVYAGSYSHSVVLRQHSQGQDSHSHHSAAQASSMALPESGILKATNSGEGFQAIGWRIAPRFIFSRGAFREWIQSLEISRIKAVMITDEGTFGYNCEEGSQSEKAMKGSTESRIEIIAPQVSDTWEQQLKDCIKA